MKCWKVANIEKTPGLARCRVSRVYTRFAALLAYFAFSTALALANEVLVLKGAAATPNNALLSPYRVLNSTDGLPQNTVYAMANGPDGRIYVGTEDGLSRFDGGSFTRIALGQPERPAAVNTIAVLGAQIWVGTDESEIGRAHV